MYLGQVFNAVYNKALVQNKMQRDYAKSWDGSLTYEKVTKYLPHFKSAIQLPIYVIGIEP
jgi:hypothetical protein